MADTMDAAMSGLERAIDESGAEIDRLRATLETVTVERDEAQQCLRLRQLYDAGCKERGEDLDSLRADLARITAERDAAVQYLAAFSVRAEQEGPFEPCEHGAFDKCAPCLLVQLLYERDAMQSAIDGFNDARRERDSALAREQAVITVRNEQWERRKQAESREQAAIAEAERYREALERIVGSGETPLYDYKPPLEQCRWCFRAEGSRTTGLPHYDDCAVAMARNALAPAASPPKETR